MKDLKDKELYDLLHKDERFRGMMEFYHVFRPVIAHERMSDIHDKAGRIQKMFNLIQDMVKQLTYADEA